jgi:DNA-binding GntR family transcriptional regulator
MNTSVQIQRSASLRDQVMSAFLALLSSGEFTPGSRVTELALAERLQVSRTPIREALGRLVQRGILENRTAGGYFVPIHTADEIRDIIAVRLLLEPAAVRMAAKQFDTKQVRILDQAIQGQHRAASEENTQKFAQANEEFRNVIFGSVSNKVLRTAIAQFDPHLQYLRVISKASLESCAYLLSKHKQIRDALAAGKAEKAETLWKQYLRHTEVWMLELLQSWQSAQQPPAEEAPSGRRRTRKHLKMAPAS